jgi:cysteine desulfurase
MKQVAYLDCAASCPLDPRVRDRMRAVDTGNPGSRTHEHGATARRVVEHARDQVASVTACRRSEVIFTSGATESNNLAILGLIDHGHSSGRTHIVTTQIEHPAVREPIDEIERRGFRITRIAPRPGGWVDAEEVLAAVTEETLLVSVMHVNNETGVMQPIEQIADGLGGSRALFHVDAAQSFGKLVAPLRHSRIDMIGASAHKIMGPQGIGALIVRRGAPLRPVMFGGGQERGLRPGTLPAHLIAGFGLASELAVTEEADRLRSACDYRAQLVSGLAPLAPRIHGDCDRSSPYIINLAFTGFDSEEVIDAWAPLAAVSNGSACTSAQQQCSYVLSAMDLQPRHAAGAIRLSWCPLTPPADWAAMVDALRSRAMEADGRSA